MEPESFANQIAGHIDYCMVESVLERLTQNFEDATDITTLDFYSYSELASADWGTKLMVSDFIKNFRIPIETIEFCLSRDAGSLAPNDRAVSFLKEYRFRGQFYYMDEKGNMPEDLGRTPFIRLEAEDSILDILEAPMLFLLNTIKHFVTTWKKVKENNVSAYLDHNAPSELLLHIEKRVADNVERVNHQDAGLVAGNAMFIGYRYTCTTQEIPFNHTLIEEAKKSSQLKAKATL